MSSVAAVVSAGAGCAAASPFVPRSFFCPSLRRRLFTRGWSTPTASAATTTGSRPAASRCRPSTWPNVPAHAEVWEKVARKLRSGEMPPSTVRSRPDARVAGELAAYLEQALDRAAVSHPNPGRAPMHRLNRAEYSNAVRDLLAVDVRPGEWLPVDDSGYGFDNIAAVLSTSPALLDRYMSAARRVSRLAVGDLALKPVEEIYDAKRDPLKGARNEQLNDDLPFDSRAGMTVAHYFPLDAEYVFKVRFAGLQTGDGTDADPYQVRVAVKAGLHTVGVTSPRENLKAERDAPGGRGAGGRGGAARIPWPVDLRLGGARVKRFDVPAPAPDVSKLIIGGPYERPGAETRRAAGRFSSAVRRSPRRRTACARTILTTLAHRAFRRPGDERRHPAALEVLPEGARGRRLRQRHSGRHRGDARVAGIPVPHRAGSATGCAARAAASDQRRRARVAAVVFPVEHDPRRRAARRGRTRQAEGSGGARAPGAADARRPARRRAGVELRGPVAPAAERRDGEAGSGHLSVRRSAAPVVPHRNGAVRLEHLPRGPQPARSSARPTTRSSTSAWPSTTAFRASTGRSSGA